MNLIGRVFMNSYDDPFRAVDAALDAIAGRARVIIVDMHAEATSEKVAMGWHLDGRVTAVIGSHTHVQTADERILPEGTAYLTDAGMCGPRDSVIGVKRELVIDRFLTQMPTRFEVAGGPALAPGRDRRRGRGHRARARHPARTADGRGVRVTVDEEVERLRGGVVDVVPETELAAKLELARREGRPLRVKLGADPSAPDFHLGHTVVLSKLREFQELGHTVIFLIGDFTARIGDPSGRSETRKPLSADEVQRNAATYTDQVFRILDRERVEVRFNSEWMSPMPADDIVRLCSHYTVARILERDDFEQRFKSNRPIGIHEFLYPLVQGYDSVAPTLAALFDSGRRVVAIASKPAPELTAITNAENEPSGRAF